MKYFYKLAVLLVTAFLLSFTFGSVFTETYIDETNNIISTDIIWTKNASPYVIYQDMLVEKGATLTIEAGVVIKFESNIYLNNSGKIIVQGTESEKVYFTSLYDYSVGGDTSEYGNYNDPYTSNWGGIYIFNDGVLNINNSEIFDSAESRRVVSIETRRKLIDYFLIN